MCASGARSPLAPTDPWHGTTGVTPRSSIATMRSSVSGFTPEWPAESEFARSAPAARTSGTASGSPVPAAWLRTKFSCSATASAGATDTFASRPKPVVTP